MAPSVPTAAPSAEPTANPTVINEDGFVLLENHENVADGYFSSDVVSSGVENAADPSANTYCIIGSVDPADYQFEGGYYWLKLIYRYTDGTNDTLEWTQTSWITADNITGADLFGVGEEDDSLIAGQMFHGLALSSSSKSYLDGTDDHTNWWHAVASTTAHNGGIPGHNKSVAYSSSLWILSPGILVAEPVQLSSAQLSSHSLCSRHSLSSLQNEKH